MLFCLIYFCNLSSYHFIEGFVFEKMQLDFRMAFNFWVAYFSFSLLLGENFMPKIPINCQRPLRTKKVKKGSLRNVCVQGSAGIALGRAFFDNVGFALSWKRPMVIVVWMMSPRDSWRNSWLLLTDTSHVLLLLTGLKVTGQIWWGHQHLLVLHDIWRPVNWAHGGRIYRMTSSNCKEKRESILKIVPRDI